MKDEFPISIVLDAGRVSKIYIETHSSLKQIKKTTKTKVFKSFVILDGLNECTYNVWVDEILKHDQMKAIKPPTFIRGSVCYAVQV